MFSKIWEHGRGCPRFQSKVVITVSYIEGFLKKGCQGDRMPMYRAFAPFFEGDKGDRRVTGVCAHSQKKGNIITVCPAQIQTTNRCICGKTC